ncbi:MAG TPA: DUF1192 domain-containing protein [Aestuariivirgaceae bacterium]|jgi:uncharacterized small protein (DUF1192 family)
MEMDEERKVKRPDIVIGEDIAILSVEELNRRIGVLDQEIARYRSAIAEKQKSRAAANSVFKL